MSGEHRVDVLYSEEQIRGALTRLADGIAEAKLENLLIVAVLKGSFMFAADLLRELHRKGIS
eukprot:gene37778-45431_t